MSGTATNVHWSVRLERLGAKAVRFCPPLRFCLTILALAYCRFRVRRLLSCHDPDRLIDFTYSYGIMRPSQVRSEVSRLLTMLHSAKPRYVLEIGTGRGATLFLLCRTASENAVIVSIDVYREWSRWSPYRSCASKGQQVIFVGRDSHDAETLAEVSSILNDNKLDFMFIDGDHTYEGVRKDFEMYAPLVRKNGLIALHDIVEHPPEAGCDVNRFWCEIRTKYEYEEIVEDSGQKWAGIGLLKA